MRVLREGGKSRRPTTSRSAQPVPSVSEELCPRDRQQQREPRCLSATLAFLCPHLLPPEYCRWQPCAGVYAAGHAPLSGRGARLLRRPLSPEPLPGQREHGPDGSNAPLAQRESAAPAHEYQRTAGRKFGGLLHRVTTKDCSSAARCHGATLDSNCLPFEPASSGIHYIN